MANISSAGDVVQPPLVGILVFFVALNVFLSISSTLANTLILVALHKVSSIYPPTKLFFRSLAISDLCVGLTSQLLFCVTLTGRITNVRNNLFYYSDRLNTTTSYVLLMVSVLTSTAISVDRLLALLLRLRYRKTVTLKRVRKIVIGIWSICCVLGVWRHSTDGKHRNSKTENGSSSENNSNEPRPVFIIPFGVFDDPVEKWSWIETESQLQSILPVGCETKF